MSSRCWRSWTRLPRMWFVDTSRQRKVRCQRNTRNIYLRAPCKPLPPGTKNANDVHESRVARSARKFPRTLAYCESVADTISDGTLGRATLVALLPHGRVFPHVDAGAYYRIRDRFHLVLRSAGGSPLAAGDERVVMRPGELWAFNNKARHWADNPSEESARAPDLRCPPRSGTRAPRASPGERWISRKGHGAPDGNRRPGPRRSIHSLQATDAGACGPDYDARAD